MDLYKCLIKDDIFLNYFGDVLEDNISEKTGYKVNIHMLTFLLMK